MASAPLRLLVNPRPAAGLQPLRVRPPSVETALLVNGAVGADALAEAEQAARRSDLSPAEILLRWGRVSHESLLQAQADHHGLDRVPAPGPYPDARLIDRLGVRFCLKHGVLPLQRLPGATIYAVTDPDAFGAIRGRLPSDLGTPVLSLCNEPQLHRALARSRDAVLSHAAETKVREEESCRFWYSNTPRYVVGLLLALLALALVSAPQWTLAVLTAWALFTLTLTIGIKAVAAFHLPRRRPGPEPVPLHDSPLPVVSVMVPLFREENIAHHLIKRLERLTYPKELLDLCLVTEEDDQITRDTLAQTQLPAWMRVITVPTGSLKTKPRALNYALDFCRGSIIGIYDAEDAPQPDQIDQVVQRFRVCRPEVACLQGVLAFYNTRQNWLARCFTVDYASWFKVVLPGIARMGLVVPLGGTTLFMRREVVEKLGGWDAHNVTEDADLGVRLARYGYRTELLDCVTQEEANCHLVPWIKQRSRWIKGYAMTWSVHMRRPAQLWRALGAWKFFGFQVLFLGSLSQFLLAPLLWSFWLLPLGFSHPMEAVLSAQVLWTMSALFVFAEAVNLSVNYIGVSRIGKPWLAPWLPAMHFYFPLAALASYKAVYEMVVEPFYWDKTFHGLSHDHAEPDDEDQ